MDGDLQSKASGEGEKMMPSEGGLIDIPVGGTKAQSSSSKAIPIKTALAQLNNEEDLLSKAESKKLNSSISPRNNTKCLDDSGHGDAVKMVPLKLNIMPSHGSSAPNAMASFVAVAEPADSKAGDSSGGPSPHPRGRRVSGFTGFIPTNQVPIISPDRSTLPDPATMPENRTRLEAAAAANANRRRSSGTLFFEAVSTLLLGQKTTTGEGEEGKEEGGEEIPSPLRSGDNEGALSLGGSSRILPNSSPTTNNNSRLSMSGSLSNGVGGGPSPTNVRSSFRNVHDSTSSTNLRSSFRQGRTSSSSSGTSIGGKNPSNTPLDS